MAVPNDIFSQSPPISYDQARPNIANGDIALFSGHEGLGPIIEHFTGSPFCHVGFIWKMADIDRIMLLESVEVVGVRMVPLSSKVNGGLSGKPYNGNLVIARHDDFPPASAAFLVKFREMTQFAADRLGCPYNAEEIAVIAAKLAAAMAHLPPPPSLGVHNAFICSEYADLCYRKIGITIARAQPDFISPADFGADPKVRPVVTIQPD